MEPQTGTGAERPAQHWKLTLAYDGTDYRGWQVQPGQPTIQGELASAIARVTGEELLPQGSGRTDAGVHALGQVASFKLSALIPAQNFMRALNRTLPAAIRVLSAEPMSTRFHARHHAIHKTYEYRVFVCDPFRLQICPPWQARFVAAVERPLDLTRMQQAASLVMGEHDFTSFAAFDPDRAQRLQSAVGAATPPSNVRVLLTSEWAQDDDNGSLFRYIVCGNGFLHHMVRNLVGTFLEVGWGERQPETIRDILGQKDRAAAGRTAPASGLFLHHVDY